MKKRIIKASVAVVALLALILSLVACGNTSAKVKDADDVASTAIADTELKWEYNADEKTLTITGTGAIPDKEIAAVPWYSVRHSVETVKINATSVTSIGNNAFYYMPNLKNIDIPEGVTSIGSCAFAFCSSLVGIELPSTLTKIGDGAFEACLSLKGIFVPANVETIGERAFAHCSGLTEAYVMSTKLTELKSNTFFGCSSLGTLYFNEALKNADGGLSITVAEDAFHDANVDQSAAKFSAATEQEVTVTVEYVVPEDAPTKPSENPLVRTEKLGSTYSFTSPTIEGYKADIAVVEGIYTETKTITVIYTPINVETEAPTDTAEVTDPAETTPEDKKNPVAQIIAIVIFAVVIVGIVVFAVFMIRADKKGKDGKNGKGDKKDKKAPKDPYKKDKKK